MPTMRVNDIEIYYDEKGSGEPVMLLTGLGGVAALMNMLNACAPGLAVVNIDNGFGGGYLAAMILRAGK